MLRNWERKTISSWWGCRWSIRRACWEHGSGGPTIHQTDGRQKQVSHCKRAAWQSEIRVNFDFLFGLFFKMSWYQRFGWVLHYTRVFRYRFPYLSFVVKPDIALSLEVTRMTTFIGSEAHNNHGWEYTQEDLNSILWFVKINILEKIITKPLWLVYKGGGVNATIS